MNETQNRVNLSSEKRNTLVISNTAPKKFKAILWILLEILLTVGLWWLYGFLVVNIYPGDLFFLTMGTGGFAFFLITLFLLFYGATFIHECGHLLSGLIVGLRFQLFIVGSLRITRKQHGKRGIRISFTQNRRPFRGHVGMVIFQGEGITPHKRLVLASGGPIASLLLAIITAGFALLPDHLPALAAQVLLITAFLSTNVFILTIIPMRPRNGLPSDGAQILLFLKGGSAVERWSACQLLRKMTRTGQPLREWNLEVLQKAIALPDGSIDDIVGNNFAYYHALETGNIPEGQKFLERQLGALKSLPSLMRPSIALEGAYFEARYHSNPEAARVWQKQAQGGKIDHCTRLRVEAAILLAEGKKDEARNRLQEGLACVKDAVDAGSQRLEEAWLKDLLQESEGQIAP
jgi:hypothetical protein